MRHRSAVGALHRLRPNGCRDRRLGYDERGGAGRGHGRARPAAHRGAVAGGARRPGRLLQSGALMRFLVPVLVLAVASAALIMTPPHATLLGLDHRRFAGAAVGASILLWLVLGGLRSARPSDIARMVSAAAIWGALLIALTGVYAYRFEASDIAGRIAGQFFPSEPQVGRGGEVIINRRLSGEFAITGRVNGARATFLFDTGASTVVLTAADAPGGRRRR